MTKKELKTWIKESKHIASIEDAYDENGNNEYTEVREKDGKLYSVSYQNGELCEAWGDRGYIRGVYKIVEVEAVEKTYTVTEYHEKVV